MSLKVAVTERDSLIVTMHEPVPVQAPLQPVKIVRSPAVAVRVTSVLYAYDSLQSAPQSIPDGELVTVPAPSPALATVSTKLPTSNVAVTERASVIVTTQGSVPVQAPPQPPNVEPVAGVAVSVTSVL